MGRRSRKKPPVGPHHHVQAMTEKVTARLETDAAVRAGDERHARGSLRHTRDHALMRAG